MTRPEAEPYWRDEGKKILEILQDARKKSYAINDQTLVPGLRSLAVPVWNWEDRVVGAVNIAVSSSLYSLEKIKEKLIPSLLKTASEISQALGFEAAKQTG